MGNQKIGIDIVICPTNIVRLFKIVDNMKNEPIEMPVDKINEGIYIFDNIEDNSLLEKPKILSMIIFCLFSSTIIIAITKVNNKLIHKETKTRT
jgi:hypothetical protein